ncbi:MULTISPECIES: hypothetical protein [Bacillaceae]|uniref:hypothetical protein n=1 Tax=Bacillaceae TaxID=186817 RepID=UPI000C773367|nr:MULTISPECIES: hypothetical protein [Bacillaceae]PLR68403.1 hypothetical protein CYJ36_09910 [Bacillus sp. UMB0893]
MRILYILLAGVAVYFAVPRLDFSSSSSLESLFSLIWLLFALLVIGGNLVGIIYAPKKRITRHAALQKMSAKTKQRAAAR